jgi:EDD domain protein, DegV family
MEKWGIHVVPQTIQHNGKQYLDRVDLSPGEFMNLLKKSDGELPKTSQPSPGTFLELFQNLTADGSEVLAIFLSSKLSGTCSTAEMAAREMGGKVTVHDSLFLSKAMQFQVIAAAQMAKAGKTVAEILPKLRDIRERTRLYVALDTLEYLYRGGRIGKGKSLIGSLLKIKPIAAIRDGLYTPITVSRSHRQVINQLLELFERDVEGKRMKGIGILHADGKKLAETLKEKILERFHDLEITVQETGPVIACHAGPGAIGLMYYTD